MFKKIIVHFDKQSENAYVTDEHGAPIPSVDVLVCLA